MALHNIYFCTVVYARVCFWLIFSHFHTKSQNQKKKILNYLWTFFIDFFLYSTVYCVQEERHREQKEQEQQKQSRLQPKQKLQEEVQKEEVLEEEEDEKAQAQRERAEQTELFRELERLKLEREEHAVKLQMERRWKCQCHISVVNAWHWQYESQ